MSAEKPSCSLDEKQDTEGYSNTLIHAMSGQTTESTETRSLGNAPKPLDESIPKSKPKWEGDQFIRKRMIIAGSSYCDTSVLTKVKVGAYIDLVAEPNNPHERDAIALMHGGERIGYVAVTDKMAFVTCLGLGRSIYGVITDIVTDTESKRYEYETWFSSK
jgi:hypothetical protein